MPNILIHNLEFFLLIASALLLISVLASKVSDRFGVPALVLFLTIGMLAGSDGIGKIYFNDPWLAKSLGVIALVFILFAGGLSTEWRDIRPILKEGILLSTIGVFLTTLAVGWFSTVILNFSIWEGLLLGAIISSTDAAAVLTVLRSNNVSLKGRLRPLLEFESGSNDPMAVFLTIGIIRLLTTQDFSPLHFFQNFCLDMGIGILMGFLMGKAMVFVVNRVQLVYASLYPVLTIALVVLTYSLTTLIKGNGFLAVYLAALILGNAHFLHKKSLVSFHEGLAWLMQIFMFLVLGLLVFPSRIVPVIGVGIAIAVFLMFLARPLAVFLCLSFSPLKLKEKLLISWVGLRGAVPIILATFPLLANIPQADMIFNIVFFIVVTSVLFQGTTVSKISKLLNVDEPMKTKRTYPIEFEPTEEMNASLEEIIVPFGSHVVGKPIYTIGLPPGSLIILICRNEKFFIPKGTTELEEGDVLLVLGNNEDINALQSVLTKKPAAEPK